MIPLISFVGRSGSGKTTLIIKLVEYFSKSGYNIGTIKHTHHNVDFDKEGKDSYRHFQAGAVSSMVISLEKIGFVSKVVIEDPFILVEKFFSHCDLVIIEGFKNDATKKIEVYRSTLNEKPLYKTLKNVLALATDMKFTDIACLNINNVEEVALFVLKEFGLK